jgi:hypothetical protein
MKRPHRSQSFWELYNNKLLVCAFTLFIVVAGCLQSVGAIPLTNNSTNTDRLPPNILATLEKQAAAMSKVTLTYSEIQSGQPLPTTNYLYIDENRIYSQTIYSYLKDQNLRRPILHEDAFDGTYFYSGTRNLVEQGKTNLVLVKYLPSDDTDPEISNFIRPFEYLQFANFYVPDSIAHFQGFGAVGSLVLHDILESDSTQVKQEGEMLRVTTHIIDPLVLRARETDLEALRKQMEATHVPSDQILKRIDALQRMANMDKWHTVTFSLDPKYGYAVVKSEEFAPTGQKTASTYADQWQYFESAKIWLPMHVVASFYTSRYFYAAFSSDPSLVITCTLNEVNFALPKNAVFDVAYNEPGAYFSDRSTPQARSNRQHQVNYTMAANGKSLRGIISNLSENRRPNVLLDCIILILAILPLLLFFISRRKTNEK